MKDGQEWIMRLTLDNETMTANVERVGEIIRCQDCTFYNDNTHTCGNPLGMIKPEPWDYCSQRKKRKRNE